jgi:hypothetical protein
VTHSRLGASISVAVLSAYGGDILAHQSRAVERGWVGLFSRPLIDWLENENQLAQLCSAFVPESFEWHRCRDEKLAPQVYVVRLWAARQVSAAAWWAHSSSSQHPVKDFARRLSRRAAVSRGSFARISLTAIGVTVRISIRHSLNAARTGSNYQKSRFQRAPG